MKRPLATVGFTYLAALIAASYFDIKFANVVIISFLILFLASLFVKPIRCKKVLPTAFFVVALAFAMYSAFTYLIVQPIEKLNEEDVTISGKICELPYSAYNRYYYIVETDKVEFDGAPQNIKLRVSMSKALDADLYDRISCKVHMFLPTDSGSFSSKTYYAAKGIHILSYLYEYENYQVEAQENKPIYYYFLKAKQTLIEAIRTILPSEQAPLAVGVLLGDKFLLDDDIKSDFREIGVSHLLAVSGLHTSAIATIVFILLQATKIQKRWIYIITCIAVACFMAITGFSASVVRAGIMLIIFYLGKLFYAKADSLNSLGISVFALTIANPFAAGDIGLLLSVAATLGIILFEKNFTAKIKEFSSKLKYCSKIAEKLSSTVSVTICATLGTMPIVMLSFGRVSLISIISNILITFPTMIMMILILIAAILYLVPLIKFVAMPLALVAGLLINYITVCANLLAKIPFASVSTKHPMILFWLAATCILILLSLVLYEKYKLLKLSGILSAIILFAGILSYQIFDRDVTHLAFLDTGNGCSAVISKGGHASVLSCGGDEVKSSKVQYYLNSQNVKSLDCLLLSDLEDSTSNYANEVVKKFKPGYVIIADEDEILDDKLERNIADNSNVVYFKNKAKIDFWGNVEITALNFNSQSYIYATINDVNILINPSGGNAQVLPDNFKLCDILAFNGVLENSNLVSSSYGIITADLDTASKAMSNAAKDKRVPVATAGDGDLVIDIKKGKNISMRRSV